MKLWNIRCLKIPYLLAAGAIAYLLTVSGSIQAQNLAFQLPDGHTVEMQLVCDPGIDCFVKWARLIDPRGKKVFGIRKGADYNDCRRLGARKSGKVFYQPGWISSNPITGKKESLATCMIGIHRGEDEDYHPINMDSIRIRLYSARQTELGHINPAHGTIELDQPGQQMRPGINDTIRITYTPNIDKHFDRTLCDRWFGNMCSVDGKVRDYLSYDDLNIFRAGR